MRHVLIFRFHENDYFRNKDLKNNAQRNVNVEATLNSYKARIFAGISLMADRIWMEHGYGQYDLADSGARACVSYAYTALELTGLILVAVVRCVYLTARGQHEARP